MTCAVPADAGLAAPLELRCGQVLRNRLMKAAMNEALGDRRGQPTAALEHLYRRWGADGFGVVVTGNVAIDGRHLAEPGNVVVEHERPSARLAGWAAAARSAGSAAWLQLNHPGRQAHPVASAGRPVAPSAVASRVPGAKVPRALSGAEIEDVVARFAAAAAAACAAGFDGVQLHAAHGFLLAQFLSPRANLREDEYGGDLQGRMRLLLEVVRAVRRAVGPGRAVAVKLNTSDFERGGFTAQESRIVVGRLVLEGVDLVEISGGTFEAPAMVDGGRGSGTEAFFLDDARAGRASAGTVPLAVTGGFRKASTMREAIASGACDVIGLARPACVEPFVARRLLEGDAEHLRAGAPRLGSRALLGRVADLRTLDSLLDVQWHTDQIHRLARGREPDLHRRWWQTGISTVRRAGAARAGRLRGARRREPTGNRA